MKIIEMRIKACSTWRAYSREYKQFKHETEMLVCVRVICTGRRKMLICHADFVHYLHVIFKKPVRRMILRYLR